MKAALIRLHVAVFLWGFTGILGKLISLNEGWLVWWRLFITAVSLWIYYASAKKITAYTFKNMLRIGGVGTVLALHWIFFFGSIKYSNVSIALTCLATSGLMSAIAEPLFFKKKINVFEIALGLFALAGISVIYMSNLHFSYGIYIGLLSTLLTVLVSIMNKKLVTDGFKPEGITLYQLTGGFLGLTLLLPFYFMIFPKGEMMPQHADWIWLFILSWCCTIFTFFLYIRALKDITAFTVNLTLTLEPVYGILLAFAVYKENKEFNTNFYLGLALILVAVIFHMLYMSKNSKMALPTHI